MQTINKHEFLKPIFSQSQVVLVADIHTHAHPLTLSQGQPVPPAALQHLPPQAVHVPILVEPPGATLRTTASCPTQLLGQLGAHPIPAATLVPQGDGWQCQIISGLQLLLLLELVIFNMSTAFFDLHTFFMFTFVAYECDFCLVQDIKSFLQCLSYLGGFILRYHIHIVSFCVAMQTK